MSGNCKAFCIKALYKCNPFNCSNLEEFWYPKEKTWAPLSAMVPSTSGTTKWSPPLGWSRENSMYTFNTFRSAEWKQHRRN